MALEADLLLNTRRWQAGVEDAERDLRDFTSILDDLGDDTEASARQGERALDELGDAGKRAGDDLEDIGDAGKRAFDDLADASRDARDDIDDAGRAGTRAFDDIGDAAKDVEDEVRDLTRRIDDVGDAGRDAGGKARDGFDRASEGVGELRDEANSTAREAAASFDGSAESIGDAFQEIAANAFAGFGPAGAVAGLAAAAGIGLAMAGFEDIAEAQEESEARVDEWASSFIDAGGRVLESQQYVAAANAILTDGEQYKTATRNAELWGVSVETAVAAMTGQHWALAEAQENVTDAAERERDAMEGIPYDELTMAALDMNSAAREGQEALDGVTVEMERGAERAGIMSDYLANLARTTEGATEEVDEFGDSVYTLPDGTTVYVDAETGRATANVDAIERRLYGLPDATVGVRVSTAAADRALNAWTRRLRTVTIQPYVRPGQRLPV